MNATTRDLNQKEPSNQQLRMEFWKEHPENEMTQKPKPKTRMLKKLKKKDSMLIEAFLNHETQRSMKISNFRNDKKN